MYDRLFTTPEIAQVFSAGGLIAKMLRFEWALALALEQSKVIPDGVAASIQLITLDDLDLDVISQQSARAGNLVIPFVSRLTALVAEKNVSLAAYVHYGATSQDVLDTATILQIREALAFLQSDLNATCATLVPLIQSHSATLLPGRTWLQQGPPVTLGLKLAGWLDAFQRHRERLHEASARCIRLQFGGAVGTLAALGDSGPLVTSCLAHVLDLPEPALPWHTHRDRLSELATTLGMITGTLGKIGRDISLLMQTEVAEVFEPAQQGRGGSSTMPHKHNPVSSSVMLAAAMRVPALVATMLSSMVQEHERGLGCWQAEWETLPEIFRLASGSLRAAREAISGLAVDTNAMRQNMDINGGIAFSEAVAFVLAPKIGKSQAHHLLELVTRTALEQHLSFREALLLSADIRAHLSIAEVDQALDPRRYLGSTRNFIDDVLAREEKN